MSVTVWVNIKVGEAYKSDEDDHSAIFDAIERLDEVAGMLHVSPLSKCPVRASAPRFRPRHERDFDDPRQFIHRLSGSTTSDRRKCHRSGGVSVTAGAFFRARATTAISAMRRR